MANLAGWPYWKVISITGQSGAATDYQVELEIGDSAGGDFHLVGHCTNFPQDIQITDDDGTTLLDHWVEDITSDPIVVHVEVKDDLGSNQNIRVYYGKSGETTASDGNSTFDFFEDFSSIADWLYESNYDASSYSFTATSGIGDMMVSGANDNHIVRYSRTESIIIAERHMRLRVKGDTNTQIFLNSVVGTSQWRSAWTVSPSSYTIYDEVWVDVDPSPISKIQLHTKGIVSGTQHNYFDFLLFRQYNSPEPTFSSAGAEQSAAGAPTGVFYGPLIGPFGGPI